MHYFNMAIVLKVRPHAADDAVAVTKAPMKKGGTWVPPFYSIVVFGLRLNI